MKNFISYKDDNNKVIRGHFEIIKEADCFLRFQSGKNQITIPWNRILKYKKVLKGGDDKI